MNFEVLEGIIQELNSSLVSVRISACVINKQRRIVWINKGSFIPFGPLDKIRGRLYSEVCRYICGDEIHAILDRVIQTGNMEKHIVPVDDSEKKKTYFRFLFIPIQSGSVDVKEILVVHIPLTEGERDLWERSLVEKHLANAMETAADAIVILNLDGVIQFWNKGAEQIFGYTADEALGRHPDFLLPEKLRQEGELEWLLKTTLAEGAIVNYETERLAKDGRIFIAEITRTVLKDIHGNIVGTSSVIKDITERKRIEEELKFAIDELSKLNQLADCLYSSRDLQEIFKLILVGVTAGEGLMYNRAFLLLVDQEENILKGHLAVGPNSPEEASRIWSALGSSQDLVYALDKYKSGIGTADAGVNAIVKQMEYRLDDDSNILTQVFRTMNPILISRSMDDGPAEQEILDRLGCDEAAIFPLFGKQLKIGVLIVDNKISSQPIREEELGILRLFGSQCGLAIENAMLYQRLSDQLEELKAANSDLKKTQTRLIEAERLATIGELTACMAHEIRNPLVSIGGFARVLQRELIDNGNLERYVDILVDETARLENILNDFLDFSRIPRETEKTQDDINKIIIKSLALIEEQIKHTGIELEVDLNHNLPNIMLNEFEMIQAFLNIFQNAIQAMENEGKISIRSYQSNNSVIIDVEDTGEGIDLSTQDKIFQPFFTTKPYGTGLGLVVTKQLLKLHNGTMDVQSKKNKGTLVRLKFPVCGEPVSSATSNK